MMGRGFGPGVGYGGHMMGGGFGWMGLIGMVLNLLFWAALIVLAVRFYRNYKGTRMTTSEKAEDNALAILRERFAKGEIDSEEFQRRKEDLLR